MTAEKVRKLLKKFLIVCLILGVLGVGYVFGVNGYVSVFRSPCNSFPPSLL